jgi:hypothetical protein
MRSAFFLALITVALPCFAQQPHAQEIQRALIQLDERSAAFARGSPPQPLDPHAGRPLHPDPEIARELRPYERMKAAEAREANVLRLPPPVVRNDVVRKDAKPLPLPGGPRAGVDPVTPSGLSQ